MRHSILGLTQNGVPSSVRRLGSLRKSSIGYYAYAVQYKHEEKIHLFLYVVQFGGLYSCGTVVC